MFRLYSMNGEEELLKEFDTILEAIEYAEKQIHIQRFMIANNGKRMLGARFAKYHSESVYWRLDGRNRGKRDQRFRECWGQ